MEKKIHTQGEGLTYTQVEHISNVGELGPCSLLRAYLKCINLVEWQGVPGTTTTKRSGVCITFNKNICFKWGWLVNTQVYWCTTEISAYGTLGD